MQKKETGWLCGECFLRTIIKAQNLAPG